MNKKLIAILIILFITTPSSVFSQSIEVKTDRMGYRSSDLIEIKLTNKSSESIFSTVASATPEFGIVSVEFKAEMDVWAGLPVNCEWPECDIDFDGPAEIKPKQTVTFQWKPKIYLGGKDVNLEKGFYRIIINWQSRTDLDSKNWVWQKITSNEFEIK